MREEPARAARLWGAANALRQATGASLSAVERCAEEAWLGSLATALGGDALARELAAGASLDLDGAIGEAARDPT